MNYDVIIATLNRPDVLQLSVPLVLDQARPPRRLIIVDASVNHEAVRNSVLSAVGTSKVEVVIVHHDRGNLPQQRNVGLEHVISPVVAFLDDDIFWWQGVGESLMRIYERDDAGDIGGVCTAMTPVPPPEVSERIVLSDYRMKTGDRIRLTIDSTRHRIEARLIPDPLWVHGASRWGVRPMPKWLAEENAAPVELMGGGRMSFRTELIRRYGFDEHLGSRFGYAAYEDADASFKIAKEHLLIGARNARVCHQKHPTARGDGHKVGFFMLFNRAYIICQFSPPGSAARRQLKPFAYYKLLQYSAAMHSAWGRDRARGAWAAIRGLDRLLSAEPGNVRTIYDAEFDEFLTERANTTRNRSGAQSARV